MILVQYCLKERRHFQTIEFISHRKDFHGKACDYSGTTHPLAKFMIYSVTTQPLAKFVIILAQHNFWQSFVLFRCSTTFVKVCDYSGTTQSLPKFVIYSGRA